MGLSLDYAPGYMNTDLDDVSFGREFKAAWMEVKVVGDGVVCTITESERGDVDVLLCAYTVARWVHRSRRGVVKDG